MSTFYEREKRRREIADVVQLFPDGSTRRIIEREREEFNAGLLECIALDEKIIGHLDEVGEMTGRVPTNRSAWVANLCLLKSQLK
jgi:hypothetical protein